MTTIFASPSANPAIETYQAAKRGMRLSLLTKVIGGVGAKRAIMLDMGNVEAVVPLYNQLALLLAAHAVMHLTGKSPAVSGVTAGSWKDAMFDQPMHLSEERLLESVCTGGTDEISYQVGLNIYRSLTPAGSKNVSGMGMALSGMEELGSLLFAEYRQMLQFNGTYMTSAVVRAESMLKSFHRRGIVMSNRTEFESFLDQLRNGVGMLTSERN